MRLDLIETRGERGKWFAAAKDAGLLDVALLCARDYAAAPATLVRAARDFALAPVTTATRCAVFSADIAKGAWTLDTESNWRSPNAVPAE